jgi:hypothetical protein
VPIKVKNTGIEITKLRLKYSRNLECSLKENNFFVRNRLRLEFRLCLEVSILENNLR